MFRRMENDLGIAETACKNGMLDAVFECIQKLKEDLKYLEKNIEAKNEQLENHKKRFEEQKENFFKELRHKENLVHSRYAEFQKKRYEIIKLIESI
jgi:hypothetical protein